MGKTSFAFLDQKKFVYSEQNYNYICIFFSSFFFALLKSTCDQVCAQEITKIQEIKSWYLNWWSIILLPT